MKGKVLTIINFIMIFIPWTILPLRENAWALESPAAEIIISCYALFMILSGIFSLVTYIKIHIQNNLMKICLIINGVYLAGGITAFGMMLLPKII